MREISVTVFVFDKLLVRVHSTVFFTVDRSIGVRHKHYSHTSDNMGEIAIRKTSNLKQILSNRVKVEKVHERT